MLVTVSIGSFIDGGGSTFRGWQASITVAPTAVPGNYSFQIIGMLPTSLGTVTHTYTVSLTLRQGPTITAVDSVCGSVSPVPLGIPQGGSIHGANFGSTAGTVNLSTGGTGIIQSWSPTFVSFTLPSNSPTGVTGTLFITTSSGQVSNSIPYTIVSKCTIIRF